MANILVTGSAGFIGSALTIKLLERDNFVIGVDNHNNYYDINLKEERLKLFYNNKNYKHNRINLQDTGAVENLFSNNKIDYVVNLAAQAGVRHSLKDPISFN